MAWMLGLNMGTLTDVKYTKYVLSPREQANKACKHLSLPDVKDVGELSAELSSFKWGV